MNVTPSTPAFEDMRSGILQAVTNRGLGHQCLIWEAVAQYGDAVGADGVVVTGGVRITESFAVPPSASSRTAERAIVPARPIASSGLAVDSPDSSLCAQ